MSVIVGADGLELEFSEIVAEHYDKFAETSKNVDRNESQLIYLRNYNNYAKSQLITNYVRKVKELNKSKNPSSNQLLVLDLGCGKGGDINKWHANSVDHVVFADISYESLKICLERYRNHKGPSFTASFVCFDCTRSLIANSLPPSIERKFSITSCQFSLHYSFETFNKAKKMIRNACELLVNNGYFIGIIPDANEIIKLMRRCGSANLCNSLFRISAKNFDPLDETVKMPLFGAIYDFSLNDAVDCPEFLLNFSVLCELVKKYDMKLIEYTNLQDYVVTVGNNNHRVLSKRNIFKSMSFMETEYSNEENQRLYPHVIDLIKSSSVYQFYDLNTLSYDEWLVIGLYRVFAFKKDCQSPN